VAIISLTRLIGTKVRNNDGEDLGQIKDIVFDFASGDVTYAVLSFGGLLGLGDKYFAVPLQVLKVDMSNEECILNEPKARLQQSPGFDKNNWPSDIDVTWLSIVRRYCQLTKPG
jgi:sporulation protein YlmC with PRC-barrel domain